MLKKPLFLMMLLLLPAIIFAQFTLKGNVADRENGASLIGAHVALSPNGLKVVTNDKGEFEFTKLKKGSYQVVVSYLGYESTSKTIDITKDSNINIELSPMSYMQEEVVVRSSRVDDKTPMTYSQVDAEELRKRNQGADLPYLLKSTPSLVVTSDAGTGVGYTGMRIRGSDLTRINVTLNGVPVNSAEDHLVYFVDLPDLASSVDNIQVQRGVGTSTNGAAAFGASINIKTDEANTTPSATLSCAAGSFNTYKSTLNFSTGRSNRGFNLTGRLSKIVSDGYIDRASSDLSSFYLSGSWSNKNTMVKALVMSGAEKTYQAWNGIPKDMVDTNPTYNPAGEMYDANGNFLGFYDNETDNYVQTYYQLHVAHNFLPNLSLTGTAFLTTGKGYYENFKNNRKLKNYGLAPIVIGDSTVSRTNLVQQKWLDNYFYGFNLALNHEVGRFKNVFGGGWNHFNGAHYGIVKWAAVSFPLDYEWYRNYGYKTDYNVFAKTTVDVSKSIALFADVQYRSIKYTLEGIHDDLRTLDQIHNYDFFNPKGGLFFTLNEKNSLYVSAAFSHREPNRDVYTDADEDQLQNVKAEKLLDYELGYCFKTQRLELNTNIYYMDYKDQLVLTGEINNVGEACMTNVDDSYRLGIEGTIDYRICKQLNLSANIALSRNKILNYVDYIEDWDNGGNHATEMGTTDISFSPAVVGGAVLTYMPFKNFDFSILSNYVGRQYLDNTSNIDRSVDPYFLTNVAISYTWEQKVFKNLNFNLSINNIFNNHYCSHGWVYRAYTGGSEYLEDGYFPQAGINFMFGVNIGI